MSRFFAIIILLAVTITLSAAIVSWILTTYYSMMWKPEILKVVEVAMYRDDEGSWWLNIIAVNEGEGVAEIYKVEIRGIETVSLNPPETVKPGEEKGIQIKLSEQYVYGTTYSIRLYLKSGTVYHIMEKIVKL